MPGYYSAKVPLYAALYPVLTGSGCLCVLGAALVSEIALIVYEIVRRVDSVKNKFFS